jgi:hypothetical protein
MSECGHAPDSCCLFATVTPIYLKGVESMKRLFITFASIIILAVCVALGAAGTNARRGNVPSAIAAPVATPTPGPRVVAGVIRRDGAITSGSGFSVLHQGGGNYLISFTPAFTQVPAVSVEHVWSLDPNNQGGSIYDTASIAGVNAQQLRVRTGFLQGFTQQVEDRDFTFIAVGR